MDTLSVSEHIAQFVTTNISDIEASAGASELTDVMSVLKLSLLDWASVAIAGTDEPVSTIVRDLATSDGGNSESHVFGSEHALPARAAAMVNGATSHALDYDDTHFMHVGHTSVVVFAAALAVAEQQQLSGKEFLEAALIGSEVCCYVGNWLGRSHYEAGFHQTATAGTFGATAAACRLLGLEHEQVQHAIGIAATRAAGLTSQFGTMSKPYHAGMAASVGVEAALLARRGFTSNPQGIDCTAGFAQTHQAHVDPCEYPLSMLGSHLVFGSVQHKLHACCHGLHASIEALHRLKHDKGITTDSIKCIRIETNPRWLAVCNKPSPTNGLASKFSYSHVSSLVFSHYNTAALSTYSDECCNDESLSRIRNLTQAVGNEQINDTATRVSVTMIDGSVYSADHDLANPLPLETRMNKLLAKVDALIGPTDSRLLWTLVSQINEITAQEFGKRITAFHTPR